MCSEIIIDQKLCFVHIAGHEIIKNSGEPKPTTIKVVYRYTQAIKHLDNQDTVDIFVP